MGITGRWLSSLFIRSEVPTVQTISETVAAAVIPEAGEVVFHSPVVINEFIHEMSGPIQLIAQDLRDSRPSPLISLPNLLRDISSKILENPRIVDSTFEEAIGLSDQLNRLQQNCFQLHLDHQTSQIVLTEKQIVHLIQLERKANDLKKLVTKVDPREAFLNFHYRNTPYLIRKGLLKNFLATGRSFFAQWESFRSSPVLLPLQPYLEWNPVRWGTFYQWGCSRSSLLWGLAVATTTVAVGVGIYWFLNRK